MSFYGDYIAKYMKPPFLTLEPNDWLHFTYQGKKYTLDFSERTVFRTRKSLIEYAETEIDKLGDILKA